MVHERSEGKNKIANISDWNEFPSEDGQVHQFTRERSSGMWEGLDIERSQLKWFRHLIRMPV